MTIPLKIRGLSLGEGRPKICVPLTGANAKELLAEIEEVKQSPADLVEWRVDYFETVNDPVSVATALSQMRAALGEMPLLFTFRTVREGGVREMSMDLYFALNLAAITVGGVDIVDVELFSGDEEVKNIITAAHSRGVAVVVSSHDFQKTPPREEIVARLKKMRALGGDVPKIAVMPQNFTDVVTLLAATDEYVSGGADCPIITMSMKKLGVISRLAGEFSGSSLSFGSVKRASAPGQLTAGDLDAILEILHTA